jgi:hypothetical protein
MYTHVYPAYPGGNYCLWINLIRLGICQVFQGLQAAFKQHNAYIVRFLEEKRALLRTRSNSSSAGFFRRRNQRKEKRELLKILKK